MKYCPVSRVKPVHMKDVQHVMDMALGVGKRLAGTRGKGAGGIGVAAVLILAAMAEQVCE
jgi:hypothetical protein